MGTPLSALAHEAYGILPSPCVGWVHNEQLNLASRWSITWRSLLKPIGLELGHSHTWAIHFDHPNDTRLKSINTRRSKQDSGRSNYGCSLGKEPKRLKFYWILQKEKLFSSPGESCHLSTNPLIKWHVYYLMSKIYSHYLLINKEKDWNTLPSIISEYHQAVTRTKPELSSKLTTHFSLSPRLHRFFSHQTKLISSSLSSTFLAFLNYFPRPIHSLKVLAMVEPPTRPMFGWTREA